MRILYLTDQVFLHGGVEKVLSQKANFFAEVYNDEVFIITTRQKQNKPVYRFSDKIKFADISIGYEIDRSYFHPRNLFKIIGHYYKLKARIKSINPDVIISVNYAPDFFFLPSILPQVPKVKEFHSSKANALKQSLKDRLVEMLNKVTERKYDALALLNVQEKDFYNSEKKVVIPNPVLLVDQPAEVINKKVIAAGRLSPVKNFGELIKVWSEVHKQISDWELHIYGEDYLNTVDDLKNQIQHLSLEKSVKLMGVSDNMSETLKNYSIYAMTSHTECFPMVLLESLSLGIPVIAYDVPTGPKFIVRHNEDGFLINYGDMSAFINLLIKLMTDNDVRMTMGKNGFENIKRFAIDNIMKDWKNLFLSLIKSKNA